MNIGTLIVSLGVDATELYGAEAAMARFGSSSTKVINGVNNSIKQLGMSFRTFGWLATTVLTAPLLLFGKAAFKAYQDYEYAMKKIQALTGVTANYVKAWTDEVLQLGPSLAKSPLELAESLYFISSSGIAATEALSVLTTSAKAASAGLGNTQKVADLVTSALNAYKSTGLTAAHVGDVLVAGVREGKAEAEGFANAVGSIIPIASQLGVTFDQVVGGMAAITLTGASAANAATYLRNMLMKLLHPASQSEKMLKKMGSSSMELRNLLRQPNGLMVALGRIKELTEKWGVESLGKVIPNIRGLLSFLSLMGQNLEHNQTIMNKVNASTGDLDKAFNVMSHTTKFKMDVALSSLNVGLIKFGESVKVAILPVIEKAIAWFNRFVENFNSMDEATKRTRLSILTFAIAIGPLSLVISVFLNGISMLGKAVMGLAEAFSWLRVVMVSNPWVAIATGVGVATMAVIHWKKKTVEAAEANTSLAKTLINVNGELKSLKSLTQIDYGRMDIMALSSTRNKIIEQQKTAVEALYKAYERAGTSRERLDYLMKVAKGTMSSANISREAAKKELSNVGIYGDYIDILQKDILNLQNQFDNVNKAMDDWGLSWEQNAKRMDLENLGFDVEENVGLLGSKVDEYAEAALRLEEAWLKIEKDVSEKRYPRKWLVPEFDIKSWKPAQFMPSMKGSFTETGNIMRQYESELDFINKKEELLNTTLGINRDLFDSVRAEISASSKAMEDLMNLPIEEWGQTHSEALMRVSDDLVKTQEAFDKLERKKEIFGILSNAAIDFMVTLGGAMAGSQNALFALVDAVLQTAQLLISALLAEAAAALIAHKAITLPIGGLVAGAIAVGALMAMWEGFKSNIMEAAEMANGGIVPPGYPKDTYPALLSSGEKVTPPGKLENVEFGGVVEFVIKEDYLYGLLDRRRRRVNSYS